MLKQGMGTLCSSRQYQCRPLQKTGYLPPCRVCQKKGSGLHYGVITCDACKGFYRRNINKSSLQCMKSDSCYITVDSKAYCPRCRLQKCIDVGMSETAIKKGRYATQRKTQYIRESNGEMNAKIRGHQLKPDFSKSWSEHGQFIQMLLDTHSAQVPSMHYLRESRDDGIYQLSRGDVYASLTELLKSVVSTDNPVDHKQYVQNEVFADIEMQLKRFINFLKDVDNFRQITVSDQVQLLKEAHFECILMENYPGYNAETQLVCPSVNKCFHKDELNLVWGEAFVEDLFMFAKSLQQTDLSIPEVLLIELMCLLSPDRCHLEEPTKIVSFKWRTVNALLCYLNKAVCCPMSRFAKIIDHITRMRTLTEQYKRTVQSFSNWPVVQQNVLLKELFQ